jgi:hypothetical protein
VGALDDPALRQDHKPSIHYSGLLGHYLRVMQGSDRAVTWAADNFDTNVVCLLDVMRTFSAVRPVGIELFKPGDLGAGLRNNSCSCIPVLYARSRYRERDEQSHRVDDEVTFSPLDLLGCIESAITSLW